MMANRHEILSLYRRCLRSMQRIPTSDQRDVYRVYVRDGFRSKAGLHPGCAQAVNAVNDAAEQLNRMNYYHSIREMKERQKMEQKNGSGDNNVGLSATSAIASRGEPISQEEMRVDLDGRRSSNCSKSGAQNTEHTIENVNETSNDSRYLFVREWLLEIIPHLHEEDVATYSKRLIDDGFDCEESLCEIREEDFDFMKKAHKRAVARELFP